MIKAKYEQYTSRQSNFKSSNILKFKLKQLDDCNDD